MIFQGYNETAVKHLQLNQVAENLFEEGRLTPPQYEAIKNEFEVTLKQPNIFIRIGLFLFTSLAILCTLLLLSFLLGMFHSSNNGWGFLIIIYGIGLFILGENLMRSNSWYRQGSDNAFIYASLICLVTGINVVLDINALWVVSLIAFVAIAAATVRYGDFFLALAGFYALLVCFLDLIVDSELPKLLLPIMASVISILIYAFAQSGSKREDLFYWSDVFLVLRIAALVVFYASINYFMVAAFWQNQPDRGVPMPFHWLFVALTVFVPVFYITTGIKNKDRVLWVLGALGVVASIMTYRYYRSILPIEWALTLAGLVLLFLALWLIKYLKTPKQGFAYLPDQHKPNILETLVMNQVLQQATVSSVPQSDLKLGGGDFDGGGAEGDFNG
ncbi:MAG: hypothetical protein JNL70_00395 [Saprospiraceae bacterium]|nr:hypothetical protein [Saprospiraceae bacterium]